ncbi:MAG TPA: outer membrane protein transport protein [Bacteroidales bacterium]|nr:outer membrane protein transport protein [Bacteroidales bacterium]
MNRIAISVSILLLSVQVFSQNENDAYRYSVVTPGGTARFTSMAGAFGALGGDFSSIGVNPAGLGVFRISEFTLTPAFNQSNIETQYYGTLNIGSKNNLSLNNLGLVLAFPVGGPADLPGWKFINLAFGINSQNNFNHRWIAQGFNNESSLMTSFLEQAIIEGSVENLNNFSTGLAWDTYLLDRQNGQFFVDMPDGNVEQRRTNVTQGSVREFVVSVGANYNNRLFLGATLGLPSVRFEENFTFHEADIQNLNVFFNSLEYKYRLTTTGTGFNLKVGAILRATDMIRLGVAIHTPTFFNLEDEYQASMLSSLTLADYTDFAESPVGRFNYELNTPMRLIGSLGLVFGRSGLISVDYERIDYSRMRLQSDDYGFSHENRTISNNFTIQDIFRIGGEYRINPLVIRAGYAFHSSPFLQAINDGSRSVFSAGIGFMQQNFFLDLGYSVTNLRESFYPYDPSLVRPIEKRYALTRLNITAGLRF